MKRINILKYLEEIGSGDYKVYINKGDDIGEVIYEIASNIDYWSDNDDCYYIDIAIEAYGADYIEYGAIQTAQAGYTIEVERKYMKHIEYWAKNLDFEELSEDIKEEIIEGIAENDMELKIIYSLIQNDYDMFFQIIRKFTYTDLNELQ
jgi:hypothetical protein